MQCCACSQGGFFYVEVNEYLGISYHIQSIALNQSLRSFLSTEMLVRFNILPHIKMLANLHGSHYIAILMPKIVNKSESELSTKPWFFRFFPCYLRGAYMQGVHSTTCISFKRSDLHSFILSVYFLMLDACTISSIF